MCFAVPLKIVKKKGDSWVMENGRVVKSLVKNVKPGDYLICQQDLGIEKVTKSKAKLIRDEIRKGL